jgi:lysophospholipase L1-like esterase
LDRDVLTQTGVSDVILLEGINDIGFSASEELAPDEAVSADQIIDGMQQIIARVQAKGARIFGATLTPFKGAEYYYEKGEEKRQTVNEFIRESGEFDGVFKFDEVTQDPDNPKQLLPKYDSGDHLHPSDAGYREMAQAVDLETLGGKT